MNGEAHKAVVMVASTKTLPGTLTVVGFLPSDAGDAGLIALPCAIAHFIQVQTLSCDKPT